MYHKIIVNTLKIHLYPTHIEKLLALPGAVRSDMLHNASLRITLTVPNVVGTENRVTSNLTFLLNTSSIARIQTKSNLYYYVTYCR